MKFEQLLEIVGSEPLFESGLLLAGNVNPVDVRRQLSRWVKSGQVYQLRRGLYALAPPYQKTKPHPFLIANWMVRGSYVSCQSALAFYGLIPKRVSLTLSVATGRPARWSTSLGDFQFHHIASTLFSGYHLVDLPSEQQAFLATPEKALIDLVHLQPGGDNTVYLHELRLQNLEQLDLSRLQRIAQQAERPKLQRAAVVIADLAQEEILSCRIL